MFLDDLGSLMRCAVNKFDKISTIPVVYWGIACEGFKRSNRAQFCSDWHFKGLKIESRFVRRALTLRKDALKGCEMTIN